MAGLIMGLLLYKPQLMIGIIVIWLLDWKRSWKALIGVAVTALLLSGASYFWMPEATLAYFTYVQRISSGLMTHPDFPIWNAHGTYTFWHGVFPAWPQLSTIMYLVTAGFGLIVFLKFYYSAQYEPPILYGAALLLTIWTTPYLMVYDWAILLIPAILFWQADREHHMKLKVVYSLMWIVMLFSGPLTAAQWHWLGWAIQISLPALALAILLSDALLKDKFRVETSPL
jgi:hypothetical protein